MHRKHGMRQRAGGGPSTSSGKKIGAGRPDATISGSRRNMPGESLSVGKAEAKRGTSVGDALAKGASTGGCGKFHEKFKKGGAVDMGVEPKGDRLKVARKRDATLEEPAFKKGGAVHGSMVALLKALHGQFEKEPQMKKLGVKRKDVWEGEPHHESKRSMRRARGGKVF